MEKEIGLKRFDERYPIDIHDRVDTPIDESIDTMIDALAYVIVDETSNIRENVFTSLTPEFPLLIGMVAMVGDSGASEQKLTVANCTSILLKEPVALKTAAGTIRVKEGASLRHPIFGELRGLIIKDAPNLLSLGRLVENGYQFHWEILDHSHLIDKNGRVISLKK